MIQLLALIETLPYLTPLPLPDRWRAILHIVLLLTCCAPALPALWRNPTVRHGYWILIAWSALMCLNAPDPVTALGKFIPVLLLTAGVCKVVEQIRSARQLGAVLSDFHRVCQGLVWLNALALPAELGWTIEQDFSRFQGFMPGPNYLGGLMMLTVALGVMTYAATSTEKSYALDQDNPIILTDRRPGMGTRFSYLADAGLGNHTAHPFALRRLQRRYLLPLTIALAVLEAILADSRTAFLALAVGLLFYLPWRYRFMLLAGCLAIAACSHNPYISRGETGMNGRTALWQYEIQKIAESPIMGYGYGIEGTFIETQKDFGNWVDAFEDSHNSLQNGYLSMMIEVGIPAFVLWLWLFLRPWRTVWQCSLLSSAFLLIIIPAIIYNFSESGISQCRDLSGILIFLLWFVADKARSAYFYRQRRERYIILTPASEMNYERLLRL